MASNSDGGVRKLAAIMFTDVKDFSKKMGENEVAAMEVLKIHDDAMREIIARNAGVVIKSLGDSFMVDFSSAVNAVRCAIEVQEQFHKHNIDKVEFEKIQVRIGIHLGDVMTIGNDLYGDGVNIAARIEAITEANRICVSAEIYNQVKNKMPIRAYSMGSIDLKNIAEPVDVYELLLDSVPGLGEPSESAKSHPTRRKADQIAAQEEEEAQRVETAKQRVNEEEERENAEKLARANEHYAKAEEYFKSGELTKAEDEIKEIYKIVQIHYEAQMLILQIEEQRAVRDEEERRRRVKEEKQRKEDERKQRIQNVLDIALAFVEKEQYQDALTALQEVYTLEPNNEQAKRIEKQVQFAEEARLERQRLESQAEEERVREESAKAERLRAEEIARATQEKVLAARKEQQRAPKIKLYIAIAVVLVLVVGAAAVFLLTRGSLKKPGTIAILPFTTAQSADSYAGEALALFINNEMSKAPGVALIDPVSAHAYGANTVLLNSQASTLGVTHVMRGTVALEGTSITAKIQLSEIGEEKVLWETNVQGPIVDLNSLASQASSALFKFMDMEVATHAPGRTTQSPEAFTMYLRGLVTSLQATQNANLQSRMYLENALRLDSAFAPASFALAKVLLDGYQLSGKNDSALLNNAASLIQENVKADPTSATAHAYLARAFRYKGLFDRARTEVAAGLAAQPNNAACFRESALLSLIQGNPDDAVALAESALKFDPMHYRSHEVKGLVEIFKEQNEDAAKQFEQASRLSGPEVDSLLTVTYKFRVWISIDQEDQILPFCQQLLERSDDRGKIFLYYLMGRAYSLKGKLKESSASLEQGCTLAEQVVDKDRRDAASYATYALLEARLAKNPKKAVQLAEQAVVLDSTSARMHYWKARVHAIQRDIPGAVRELSKAISLQYSFPEILDADFLSIWQDPQFKSVIARK
ncbi:MAG TPA: adenylate/guanylate cyclase domain-containing protein [Bacteroidota bacterium]|nr:adenylate/guanylate cyclase domain-containing protein [Bacteroidota bacterium]